jgi:hypothetical protein
LLHSSQKPDSTPLPAQTTGKNIIFLPVLI